MLFQQQYIYLKSTADKDIGACFGIGESGVSQDSRRVKERMRNDKKLWRNIARVEKKLIMSRMKTWPLCFNWAPYGESYGYDFVNSVLGLVKEALDEKYAMRRYGVDFGYTVQRVNVTYNKKL